MWAKACHYLVILMAERLQLYERRWARTAVTAVGLLALGACSPKVVAGDNYNPDTYANFGRLECYDDPAKKLTGRLDFSDKSVHAIAIYALLRRGQAAQSMRVKFFGPDSTVVATRQDTGQIDIDQGIATAQSPLVIDSVLPGVKVTATVPEGEPSVLLVTAECNE
jgi:hypothetical protein